MPQRTLIHIVGNRPQFVKLAVLYNAIKETRHFRQIIVHTGQHYSEELNDIFFDELTIPVPDYHFNKESKIDLEFIAQTSERISTVLKNEGADAVVFLYGDTNSTLAGALAAARNNNPLVHFESGVRTESKSMPEEINRVLTDRLSDVHFCCTEKNHENIIREGYGSAINSKVYLSGDLMLDAFCKIRPSENRIIPDEKYVLCTIHRAENISDANKLSEIASALNELNKEIRVVIPIHPHTDKKLKEYRIKLDCTTLNSVGYLEMKRLIIDAESVITDSGGTFREAYFARKKSVVIMESPFWPEIIEAGAALRTEAKRDSVIQTFHLLNALHPKFDLHIFGNGKASERIAHQLTLLFG